MDDGGRGWSSDKGWHVVATRRIGRCSMSIRFLQRLLRIYLRLI